MADDEKEVHEATYYKLSQHASIFHDPTQPEGDGKILKGQVVKLEPTAAVLVAYRQHHILHASEKQFNDYTAKVKKENDERAAKKAAANPPVQVVAAPAGTPATVAAAKTQAATIVSDAEKKANKIIEEAQAEAERIKTEAAKPAAN